MLFNSRLGRVEERGRQQVLDGALLASPPQKPRHLSKHPLPKQWPQCLSPSADNAANPRRGGGAGAGAALLPAAAPAGLGGAPPGRAKLVSGRRHVGVLALEPLGRYALRVRFDDLHEGIYPFDFLRELGERRMAWAKAYLRAMRRAGLSRDPARARPLAGGGGGSHTGGSSGGSSGGGSRQVGTGGGGGGSSSAGSGR